MYTETYARLTLKRCQRSALAAQLKQLGMVRSATLQDFN